MKNQDNITLPESEYKILDNYILGYFYNITNQIDKPDNIDNLKCYKKLGSSIYFYII